MTALLLVLFAFSPELVLPMRCTSARIHWQDLNRDGLDDIWIFTDRGELWFRDERDPDTWRHIATSPDARSLRPVFRDGLSAETFRDGAFLEGRSDRWQLVRDFRDRGPFLSDIEPVHGGNRSLLPTHDGYLIVREGRVEARLDFPPQTRVAEGELLLTYVIPEWKDLDGDGDLDLLSPPLPEPTEDTLEFRMAVNEPDGWRFEKRRLRFPGSMEVKWVAMGRLDRDPWEDLAILARPRASDSLFAAMHIYIYRGDPDGGWQARSHQILTTRQRHWQVGTLQIDRHGIFEFYYKGMIRTLLRIDFYPWLPEEVCPTEPKVTSWSSPGADRGVLLSHLDLTGDGLADLILKEGRKIYLYPRRAAEAGRPFKRATRRLLATIADAGEKPSRHLKMKRRITADHEIAVRFKELHGPGDLALVPGPAGSYSVFRLEPMGPERWRLGCYRAPSKPQ